jgi:hypothetical protein
MRRISMRRSMSGWTFVLAVALAVPTLAGSATAFAKTKTTKTSDDTSTTTTTTTTSGMSKEDQEKLKEHNKLRSEVKKVKYPASKADVVAHVKGLKADDKKWFDQTLPDKTYSSADDVFSALGWETTPAEGATGATGASGAEKTTK